MNGTGNDGGSITIALPDIERARDYLRAKRDFYGAETPIGHRCSNLDEALLNYPNAPPDAKAELDKNMTRWIAELEVLCAKAGE